MSTKIYTDKDTHANTETRTNTLGDTGSEGLAKECLCLTFVEGPHREKERHQPGMSLYNQDVRQEISESHLSINVC